MLARLLVAAVALAAAALAAAPAAAAPNKPFALDVAPAREWAGVTDGAYTVKLTNNTGTQNLGSADVTIPTTFTVVGAPSLGTVVAGNVLQLRNLDVPPGGSVTVTLGLRMPCVSGGYTWSVVAKQSNDFSGPPGNALGPVSGNRTTTVEGSCKLRFVNQPKQTERNTQIRADALQPASTDYVSVEAVDGRPLDTAQRMTWFNGEITLAPSVGTFTATSDPTSMATDEGGGLAHFENLVIDPPGLYTLHASTAAGWVGDSHEFEIPNFVSPCLVGDGNCTTGQKLGKDGTAFNVTGSPTANGGKLVLSPNLGVSPTCAGYNAPSTDFYKFELTQSAALTAQLSHNKANVRKVGGRSGLEVCFASPENFTGKGGTVPFDYDGAGPSSAGHVGLLFDCADLGGQVSPCIDGRTGTAGGGAVITVSIPPAWSDPMCR